MEAGAGGLLMLYEAVRGASSQDPRVLKEAEGKLTLWESHQGFYPALANLISTISFESSARFMAAVTLKNGIERHWRNAPGGRCVSVNEAYRLSSTTCIVDHEKTELRNMLEHLILTEPLIPIATQLSVIIAKIARLDVPREWPTLLPLLLENIRSADPDKQYRALMATYHVIKILSTKRLTGDRKVFQNVAADIFDYLCGLWDTLFLAWANSGASGDHLQRAHFALKILRILTIRGYKVPHESPSVGKFIPVVMSRAKETLELRVSRQDSSVLLEKHVITMWKIVGDLLETHPLSFVPFLQPGLEFTTYFGFSEEGRTVVFERVAIHALNLLKGIILCPEFRTPRVLDDNEDSNGRKNSYRDTTPEADPLTFEAAKVKSNFFSEETLGILVRVLVTRFLPLSKVELDSWNDDPEEFALRMEDSGETWKYNLRQSAETLLVTLFKEYRRCVEVFLSIMNEFKEPLADSSDLSTILAKDAIYNAAGIVAYELYDEFCFDTWLNSTLVHELSLPVPILHRRITWLIGQWTGVKIRAESRPVVFNLLLSGLRSPDVVVRLSSAQALRCCLDDFEFVPEQFTPFMNDSFHSLFGLLQDVRECDNKMRVLHTMSFLIERTGSQIKSSGQIPGLTQYLPLLWNSDHNMLKAAVVSTSIQLVHALGSESACLRDFLFPVIRISTDLNSPEHIYLLEDGLELWHSMLEYTSSQPDDGFVSLVDNLIPLLGISTEHLKMCLSLVNSYCLIYPELFAERFGSLVSTELNSAIGDMRVEGIIMVLRTIEIMLRTSPIQGPQAVKPIVGKIFKYAYEAMDTPILMSHYLSVVSRLLLISEPVFQLGLSECLALTDGKSASEVDVLATLTDVMSSKVSYISQPERKKLICIGLLKLLSTADQTILHRACGLFLAVAETLNDILKPDSNGVMVDSLCLVNAKTSPQQQLHELNELVTENDYRKKHLASRDVVYTLDLGQLFRNEVVNLRARLGEAHFNDVMSTIDVETMALAKPFLE